MPFFGWRCPQCDKTEVKFEPKWREDMSSSCECGAGMERDLTVETRRHIPGNAFPYITTNITGQPLEIKSLAHLREVEKIHGVRQRDDSDFVEEQWQGWDFQSKQHRYGGRSGGGRHSTRWV